MSNAKHMPATWQKSWGSGRYYIRSNGRHIATVFSSRGIHSEGTNPPDKDEASDNARLIAAAPELLEVLEKLCSIQEAGDVASWAEEWDEARAAIAKATGA